MARVENSDYDKLVKAINAMQALVAEADEADAEYRRFMLYGEQCRAMVHQFMHMRRSMSIGEDGESTPILRELYHVASEAKRVLESCTCIDQTSWLQAALVQNEKMVFEIIQDDLKRGFSIFLEVGNSSTAERPIHNSERESLFVEDQDHLKGELQRLITDANNAAPELNRLIAALLLARLNNEKDNGFADRVDQFGEAWNPQSGPSIQEDDVKGNGASATVHVTRWFGMNLARKIFKLGESTSCLNEVSLMAELKHPNVVRFISSSVRSPAIIMECMEMNLKKYLKKRRKLEGHGAGLEYRPAGGRAPFSAANLDQLIVAVDIMYQISRGMAYLHAEPHSIAHLDLKPANILVNLCEEGDFRGYIHVKIADLGVSIAGIGDDFLSRISNPTLGTTLYQAPETFRKGKVVCMKKADLFAFGIICWEILHLQVSQFPGVTNARHREEVNRGRRLVIDSSLCPDDYLGELIQECWQANPNRRPTFSACSLALESYKAKLLGRRRESLFDFKVPPESVETRIRRRWRILMLHVKAAKNLKVWSLPWE